MPDPFTIFAALSLGALGTMIAAGSDDESEETSSPSSSSDDPCDWSYDSNDYGPSSSDHQTTLSDFD